LPASTLVDRESYKRAFTAATLVFFIAWAIIAIGLHLPAKSLYAPPGSSERVNGAPLNWWMIQLSIGLGVVLAFVYAFVINKLDEKFGIEA
jgi:putative solute:sodium symporter small subunit